MTPYSCVDIALSSARDALEAGRVLCDDSSGGDALNKFLAENPDLERQIRQATIRYGSRPEDFWVWIYLPGYRADCCRNVR